MQLHIASAVSLIASYISVEVISKLSGKPVNTFLPFATIAISTGRSTTVPICFLIDSAIRLPISILYSFLI